MKDHIPELALVRFNLALHDAILFHIILLQLPHLTLPARAVDGVKNVLHFGGICDLLPAEFAVLEVRVPPGLADITFWCIGQHDV